MELILLIAVPLSTGLVLAVGGRAIPARGARVAAVGAAVIALGLAIHGAMARPDLDWPWIRALGVRFSLGGDEISVPLILLTALIGVLVVALGVEASIDPNRAGTVLGCLLMVEAGALATFLARDAILFVIAFDVVLVPMWVLISRYGDAHDPRARAAAGTRFLLYTAVGSTLVLVGALLLVTSAGTSDLRALVTAGAALPTGRQIVIAVLLTIGLAVKVPVWPLHTWLPAAHTIAPTVGSVVLAAVLLKMGTYGLVRLPLATVPDGFAVLAPWLAIAGVIGILWGSLVCLVEQDLKRVIAFSSVAHMGFVVLGISTRTEIGLQGALYGNIAHGVISALLFVVVGGVKAQWGSVDLSAHWPALREVAPRRGFFLILGLAATMGLPGLAGFWGEFFAIVGAWRPTDLAHLGGYRTGAILAAVGGLLAAAYALRVAARVWMGEAIPANADHSSRPDPAHGPASNQTQGPIWASVEVAGAERGVLLVFAAGIGLLGVAPWVLVTYMAPAVRGMIGGVP